MIKSLKTFFFPDDTKLKIECKTDVFFYDGKVIKIHRRFYTLRSLWTFLTYEYFVNPIKKLRESYLVQPTGFVYQFAIIAAVFLNLQSLGQISGVALVGGAIAFDATSNANNDDSTLTLAHTCTGSNLVLTVSTASYRGESTCTYNGVSMTKGVNASQGQAKSAVWYLANPATGAKNVLFTPVSSGTNFVCAVSFSGANTASPIGTNGTSTAVSSTTISKAVTTTFANSFLVDCIGTEQDAAHVYGADAGQTQRMWAQINSWSGGGASTKPTTTTGSYTLGWTKSSGTTAIALSLSVLEIRELVASGPANLKSYNTNLSANIKSIDTNPIANIKSLNTNI